VEVVVMVGGIIGIDNMKKYMLDFNWRRFSCEESLLAFNAQWSCIGFAMYLIEDGNNDVSIVERQTRTGAW